MRRFALLLVPTFALLGLSAAEPEAPALVVAEVAVDADTKRLLAARDTDAKLLLAARAADLAWLRHIDQVHADLASPDPTTRLSALRQAGNTGDPRLAAPVAKFLDAKASTAEVVAACTATTQLGNTAATTSLRDLLHHDEPAVRQAAYWALEQLDQVTILDHLGRSTDVDDPLRGAGLTSVAILAPAEATAILVDGLSHHPRALMRRMCAMGLGRLGDRTQGPHLQKALTDGDPGVRRYAGEALALLGYTPAIPHLLMALESNIAADRLVTSLKRLSGDDFGFDPHAHQVARTAAIDRGWAWWAVHAKELDQ